MDHGRLPAWRRGIELAHTVCAAVAAGRLASTEAGQKLRRAAVSVPSLVGEAFLDLRGPDASEALAQAAERLSEVGRLLSVPGVGEALGEAEQSGLLAEVASLRGDLDELRRSLGPGLAH